MPHFRTWLTWVPLHFVREPEATRTWTASRRGWLRGTLAWLRPSSELGAVTRMRSPAVPSVTSFFPGDQDFCPRCRSSHSFARYQGENVDHNLVLNASDMHNLLTVIFLGFFQKAQKVLLPSPFVHNDVIGIRVGRGPWQWDVPHDRVWEGRRKKEPRLQHRRGQGLAKGNHGDICKDHSPHGAGSRGRKAHGR